MGAGRRARPTRRRDRRCRLSSSRCSARLLDRTRAQLLESRRLDDRPRRGRRAPGTRGPCHRASTASIAWPSRRRARRPAGRRRRRAPTDRGGSRRRPDSITPSGKARRRRKRWFCSAATGSRGPFRGPECVDRGVDRHDLATTEHEHREQPALEGTVGCDVGAARVGHPQRPEHVDPHAANSTSCRSYASVSGHRTLPGDTPAATSLGLMPSQPKGGRRPPRRQQNPSPG